MTGILRSTHNMRMSMWLTLLLVPLMVHAMDYSDLPGDYCRTRRPVDCCTDRRDDCSVPILGTLCYCDEFCNRTRSEDCCPDYWRHCLGIEPPQKISSCYHNGNYYFMGQRIKINCNYCNCTAIGDQAEFLCERNECLVEPEIIQGVNDREYNLGWRASNFTEFWGRRLDEGISLRLGTLQPQKTVMRMRPILKHYDRSRLPRSFDARTKPEWRGYIHPIRDQGWCGSSWAVSTAAVGSDRFAIMSQGMEKIELSSQHLLSCNVRGQRGCHGGSLDRAWFFLRKYGVVDEDCYPYTAGSGKVTKCRLPKRTNLLTARCSAPQNPLLPARTETYRMGPAYRLGSEHDIMHEIMESGPVQATMRVFHDFFVYRGGVYQQSKLGSNHRTGYHSVRIIGWGEDNSQGFPIKYWLVANSWGSLWGENGYFRIRRGVNECEIEDFVLASWADTLNPPVERMSPNNRISNVI
ncbi:uncharacterized peptidase C1-like protein F26E4.3 [Anabrus simplex]|uniref:uncharacterized peptidase C1-like protein F26E4.3 n=1 Tax=Anabrus simplex TaxID=316456 RepID=UPI0035A35D40